MFPASNHGPGQNVGFPDPCLTPATPPVVVPYPNMGNNSMAAPTAPNVLVSGMPSQNQGSIPSLTNGDNAGSINPLGMMKPGGTTLGNPIVLINGLPSKHLLCPSQGNSFNNPLGATLIPDVVNVLYCDLGESARVDLFDLPDRSLGLTAVSTQGGLRVVYVRRGGLGGRLGVRPDDLLIEQDARPLAVLADLLPVSPGARTRLRVLRRGCAFPLERVGCQGRRRAPAVAVTRRGAREARIVLRRLSKAAPTQLRQALHSLRARGVERLELDLRGNPGGGLVAAAAVAGCFLQPGSEAARLEVAGREVLLETTAEPSWTGRLLVRVDRQTASAAEVVASALRARDRAGLRGETSYGKVTVEGLGLGRVGRLTSVPSGGLAPDER